MNVATRLGGFALGLVAVFGAAWGVGQVAGPTTPAVEASHDGTGAHDAGGHDDSAGAHLPGGLLVSDHGYTLVPAPAPAGQLAFQVTGPDGRAVTGYDVQHDKRMHLIVARRDLSGFRHVHPAMDPDGTWRVASPLGGPGSWRAFADFKPTGAEALTLGVDLAVPGVFNPQPLPVPARTATVDGYAVTLTGDLVPGSASKLTLTVSRDGKPVTDLAPYLGAYGHLVALRQGDLAYLHVHPDGAPGDGKTSPGPEITFFAEVPSGGTYRLFLDFQHAGKVRTAEFTAVAGPAGATSTATVVPATPTARPTPATRPTAPPSASVTPDHGEPGHGHS